MMPTSTPTHRPAGNSPKRARLRAARLLAFSLLAVAGVLYVIAQYFRPGRPWLGFVAAFSEAAMVGALADWFAVVALFRHPLGLPLPHTAIISANKRRIADSLGEFIQSRFLSTDKVLEGIRTLAPGRRIARWISRPDNSARIQDYLGHTLARLLGSIDHQQARGFLTQAIASGLDTLDVSTLAAQVLRSLSQNRRHQWLLDEALEQLYGFLQHEDVRKELVQAIARQMEFVPSTLNLDERVGRAILQRLYDALQTVLQAVREDHDHVLRRRFDEVVLDIVDKLMRDKTFRERVQTIQTELRHNPEIGSALSAIWDELQRWLGEQLGDTSAPLSRRLAGAVQELAETFANSPRAHIWIDAQIASIAPPLIERYRRTLGLFMSVQVKAWNDTFLVDQIELNIGR
ncbi:MAG: DUF445 domain-containing protein, partial [Acidiferrobacter sp.]